MKQLVCEMCGSTDLVKDGGVFICQSCGVKYTVEEARKMMVEGVVEVTGTVQVDETNRINNLIKNIIRAFESSKNAEAYRLCAEVLNIDPENPEALVYRALSDGWQIKYANVTHVSDVKDSLEEALQKARARYGDVIEYGSLATTAILQFRSISKACKDMCTRVLDTARTNAHDFRVRNKNAGYAGLGDWAIQQNNQNMQREQEAEDVLYTISTTTIADGASLEAMALKDVSNPAAFTPEMLDKIYVGGSPQTRDKCKELKNAAIQKKKEEEDGLVAEYWEKHREVKAMLETRYREIEHKVKSAKDEIRQIDTEIADIKARVFVDDPTLMTITESEQRKVSLEKEVSSLGLFKGKRKRELQSEISQEENYLNALREKHDAFKKQQQIQFEQETRELRKKKGAAYNRVKSLDLEMEEISTKLASGNGTIKISGIR